MIDRKSFEVVRDCVQRGQRFVLTTHLNPDGDGLGSEAALAAFLTDISKDVFIFNNSSVPANYQFLDPDGKMILYDSDVHRESLLTADFIFILDISDWERLRQVGNDIKDISIKKICIDHHPVQKKFGDIRLIDEKACSTGELVFELIKYCGGQLTKQMAEALYTSILTDTGSFKFSNTNANAFRICAELVEIGIDIQKIYQNVYECQSLQKIRLFGQVLTNLKLEANGRIAWFVISKEMLEKQGAKTHDTEGFADYPRVIAGVEISIMFIEVEKSRIKVSLRSKGNYIINGVAQKFGGGGHPFAAGILLEGRLDEFIPKILEETSYLFT